MTRVLYAYSDASVKGSKAAATTLIVDDTKFIACFTNNLPDNTKSTEAELRGVVQTMYYISENCSTDRDIVIVTDNKAIAIKYITLLKTQEVSGNSMYRSLYEELLKYSKGFHINVQNIRGHQQSHNPNKVCDVLSRVAVS